MQETFFEGQDIQKKISHDYKGEHYYNFMFNKNQQTSQHLVISMSSNILT